MKSKSGKKISFKGQATANAEERAKRTSGYGYLNLPKGLGVFSPEPGKSVTLDFFPYEVTAKNHPDKHEGTGRAAKGAYWYKRPFKIHRNIGSEKDSVVCLGSVNKPCPICEYKVKRAKEGADVEELKSLKTGDRELYIVNPLDSAKHDAGKMYVFDISYYLFQEFLESEMKEDVPDDFFDPEEGVSLKVRFKATTMGAGKPFADADKITVVDRKKQYKEAFYSEAPDLDSLLSIMTYDELWAKFFEVDKEETEVEEEAPRVKKTTKKVVEEEEEEEAPAAPVRKKKPIPVEEEEEEEPDLTWEELALLNEKQLVKYVKANDVPLDIDDFEDDEDGLRKAIAEALDIEVPKKKGKPTPAPIAKADRCPACKGTGKDGKGKICKVCMGTGVKQADPDEEEEEEEEEETPVAKKGNKAPAKKATASDECPHDHTFGKDVDKYDECDECDLWDECQAAKKKK
ncbi:MAG: hypothetical protein WC827_03760 [Candidatus Paceibacterota bacterium]|jgi:hypothetical protein